MTAPRFVRRIWVMPALLTAAMAGQTNVGDWSAVKALAPGTQVRVAAGSRTVSGRIGRITDDAVAVTSGNGQENFDRQQVSAVSVKKPSHRKRNTLIGLAAGTGTGLVAGLASRSKAGQLNVVSNSAVVGALTAAGAVVGAIVGLVVPTGGWREIYKK